MQLDQKSREALDRLGAKKILADLANVPALTAANSISKAQEFVDRYGPLRRPQVPALQAMDNALDVVTVGIEFRKAWHARTQNEIDHVSMFLDSIFEPNPFATWEGSAVRANFALMRWEPVPRTLLDVLAIQLMRSRKMLHRCERPECQRYMVKEFSRDRYCSRVCAEDMRSRGQSKWATENREQIRQGRNKRSKARRK